MPTLDTQDLVPGLAKTLRYRRLKLDGCSGLGAILALDQGPEVKPVGVSMRLSGKGVITAVALATETTVLQLNMEGLTAGSNAQSSTNALAALLGRSDCLLAGIGMPRIALLLRHQHQADGHAIDLPLLHKGMVKEGLPSPGILAKELLGQGALEFKINALWYRETNDALCLRAWLSACIASKSKTEILASLKLRTHHLPTSHLQCLSVVAMNIELLEAMKPTQMQNEFKDVFVTKGGEISLLNSRFKSRVRKSRQTRVEFNGGKMIARPVGATGKHTTLTISGGRVRAKEITHIRVLGREEATCAELARDFFITQILQGEMVLDVSPFVRMLWFPNRQKSKKKAKKPATDEQFASLNDSQRRVAAAMIADGEPLVIAHGPPGTGKTSTIAAALKYWQDAKQAVWVVAQSNVGVKNIARSIVKKHINFRLIVSKEFHFEWHEHLYTTVEDKIIRSDELFGINFDPVHRIGKAKIILSTLSMLSNPWMVTSGIYAHCPVQYLVVDEASQIDTVVFMHLFDKFDKLDRLHKVCMFGDPEQLPPYGKDKAKKMKTIFDFQHLKTTSYFLDTQYRMPVPLGEFISKQMYRSKLKSMHDIKTLQCIRAIDVRKGEVEMVGSSSKNVEEARTVVNLVKHYYRKLKGDYCIITPYDAQRGAITDLLTAANLPADNVYNVDSFQGHEAPYVIISVVKTTKPGFLDFANRVNVMLTRCQKGMVIVTQRAFIDGGGRNTLVGKLVKEWEKAAGEAGGVWADAMEVADGRTDMPGAPGKGLVQGARTNASASASAAGVATTSAVRARATKGPARSNGVRRAAAQQRA